MVFAKEQKEELILDQIPCYLWWSLILKLILDQHSLTPEVICKNGWCLKCTLQHLST